MKITKLFTSAVLLIGLSIASANAKNLILKIDNVRSAKGKIMAMVTIPGLKEPLYRMVDATVGEVVLEFADIEAQAIELSLYHDEDGNFKLAMGDRGPLEGYVTKKCKLLEPQTELELKLYYPN